MSAALQALTTLEYEHKRTQHPAVPAHAIPKPKFSDRDANGLTRCIVRFIELRGGFASRLSSTGTFRADLQRFVSSQQRAGLPDVLAVVGGLALFVEVKIGKDRLSDDQRQTIADLQEAGALVFVATDFAGFFEWFEDLKNGKGADA